jgi:hypothetical protein
MHQDAVNFAQVARRSDSYLKAFLASEKQVWSCEGTLASCASGLLLPLRFEEAPAPVGGEYCINRITTAQSGSVLARRFCP